MRSLYAAIFSLVPLFSFGQNYQAVNKNTIRYYEERPCSYCSGYTLAAKVDSAVSIGADSVYYFYNTTREDQSTYLANRFGASWFGDKMIVTPSGHNIFFNESQDSIRFHTQAGLNAAWKMYDLSNGDHIEAKVVAHDTATIENALDSVKTIVLQAKNSSNSPIAHLVNGMTFGLSKDHGFTKLHELYRFPLYTVNIQPIPESDTITYGLSAMRPLTVGEIYDFNPGDHFQFTVTYYKPVQNPSLPPVGGGMLYRTVLAETWSAAMDTVGYFIRTERYTRYWNFSSGPPVLDYQYQVDSTWHYYTDLSSPVIHYAPGESYLDTSNQGCDLLSMEMYSWYPQGGIWSPQAPFDPPYMLSKHGWYQTNDCDTFYVDMMDNWAHNISYIKGCGSARHYSQTGFPYTETEELLTYYGKGNVTWGSPNYMNISEAQQPADANIYPNPANSGCVIELKDQYKESFRLTLYDITGRAVKQDRLSIGNTPHYLDLKAVPAGYYILVIEGEDTRVVKKLTVSR